MVAEDAGALPDARGPEAAPDGGHAALALERVTGHVGHVLDVIPRPQGYFVISDAALMMFANDGEPRFDWTAPGVVLSVAFDGTYLAVAVDSRVWVLDQALEPRGSVAVGEPCVALQPIAGDRVVCVGPSERRFEAIDTDWIASLGVSVSAEPTGRPVRGGDPDDASFVTYATGGEARIDAWLVDERGAVARAGGGSSESLVTSRWLTWLGPSVEELADTGGRRFSVAWCASGREGCVEASGRFGMWPLGAPYAAIAATAEGDRMFALLGDGGESGDVCEMPSGCTLHDIDMRTGESRVVGVSPEPIERVSAFAYAPIIDRVLLVNGTDCDAEGRCAEWTLFRSVR